MTPLTTPLFAKKHKASFSHHALRLAKRREKRTSIPRQKCVRTKMGDCHRFPFAELLCFQRQCVRKSAGCPMFSYKLSHFRRKTHEIAGQTANVSPPRMAAENPVHPPLSPHPELSHSLIALFQSRIF